MVPPPSPTAAVAWVRPVAGGRSVHVHAWQSAQRRTPSWEGLVWHPSSRCGPLGKTLRRRQVLKTPPRCSLPWVSPWLGAVGGGASESWPAGDLVEATHAPGWLTSHPVCLPPLKDMPDVFYPPRPPRLLLGPIQQVPWPPEGSFLTIVLLRSKELMSTRAPDSVS